MNDNYQSAGTYIILDGQMSGFEPPVVPNETRC
jgi:hypothetical protein